MNHTKSSEKKQYHLPPRWCSFICVNSMSQVCVEGCAARGDCSGFEIKKEITYDDLPLFSFSEWMQMSRIEKGVVLAAREYLRDQKERGLETSRNDIYFSTNRIHPRILKPSSNGATATSDEEQSTPMGR